MKNLSFSLLMVLFISAHCNAQLTNTGFETWSDYTSIWGYEPYVPLDTFNYDNPDGWTSDNQATGNTNLGAQFFVTQSNDAHSGNYAVRMETGVIDLSILGVELVLPGFVANGDFYLNLVDVIGAGGQLSPMQIPGAGTPVSTRKEKISIYAKYEPIVNDTLNDSLLVWAVLKKDGQLVGEARVGHGTTNGTYQMIEANFHYVSCEMPDTLVVMIASSIPDFSGITGGNSGLAPGSVLLVDDIYITDLDPSFNFPPVTAQDEAVILNGVPKTVSVLVNDFDCESDPLTVSIPNQTGNGTATVVAGDSIMYVPNTGYLGVDSVRYAVSDGNNTSYGLLRVSMLGVSGVDEVAKEYFSVYPNPVENGELYFNKAICGIIYNGIGQVVTSVNNAASIDVGNWEKGLYIIKTDDNLTSRFVVK